ncbi:MAG: exonuclease SbcCD subunit D [Fervidobacterium sp.]|nr:exonuclease SbcCD subunit D [Fervidobacterium sp.]
MKILHTSDWHLGRRPAGGLGKYSETRYQDFFVAAEHLVKTAIEENVDLVIISGDLFDSNRIDPDILHRTENILKLLKEANITVLAIEGNHDISYDRTSWLNYLEKKQLLKNLNFSRNDNLFEFKPYIYNGIPIYGIPYQGTFTEETLQKLSENIEGQDNIVICHTAISNDESGRLMLPGCTEQKTINLFQEKVMYFAAGHFHSYRVYPKNQPFFFVPGSLEYWDLREKEPKGYVIFDTETKTHKFYHSYKRKRSIYKIKLSELEDYINNINISEDEIIIFDIIIDKPKIPIWDDIKEFLKTKGALYVEFETYFPEDYGQSDYNISSLTKEQIERNIILSWNNLFSKTEKNVELTLDFLQEAKNHVHEGEKSFELIFSYFDKLLDEIIEVNNDDN